MGCNEKIKKISMTNQVYQAIHDKIVSGFWKIGDKLPSESELATQLGVNRLTVRLALQKLSTLGFIETRVGEGSFVIASDFLDTISEFAKYYMDDEIIDDVEEFRSSIELRCIELAVVNASDEELDMLERCCEQYEACQANFRDHDDEANFTQLMEADYIFHRTLCELSHNKLYSYAYSMAKEPICRFISIIISERDERKKNSSSTAWQDSIDNHRRLLNALRCRDIRNAEEYLTTS